MARYTDEQSYDQLVYVLSHDLGAPARALRQYIVLLEMARAKGDTEGVDRFVSRMRDVLDRFDGLLDDVLDLSRLGRDMACSWTDPRPIIEESAASHSVAVDLPDTLRRWPLDSDGARVVIDEIVKNVRDHGAPPLTVRDQETSTTLWDEGPGIDCAESDVFMVFRPVPHPKSGHRGLGLARASKLVRHVGGQISVECPPAGGTMVTLEFAPPPTATPST